MTCMTDVLYNQTMSRLKLLLSTLCTERHLFNSLQCKCFGGKAVTLSSHVCTGADFAFSVQTLLTKWDVVVY